MILLIISFFAWVLTILAPCVLPLLPIILAGSLEDNNKKWPYIIIASLAISMILFSILLKTTTLFITVSPRFWAMFSGWLIIWLWIITLFPDLWSKISTKLGFENKSSEALQKSTQTQWYKKNILTGFALWPVFTSCSPTYALILAIILPAWFAFGLINLIMYALWLSVMLLLIAIFWQRIVSKLKIVANPKWYFKKILAIIFIIIWLAIFTGTDKKIETYLISNGYFIDLNEFENGLIKNIDLEKKDTDLKTNNKIMENTNLKNAYFAWGCFWCMEWIFEAQPWVKEAISWYAGWTESDANYDIVSTGKTQHREAVKVVYDPSIISYEKLVELYWSQIDPTDPNWQFADKWYQYTTAIIYENEVEKQLAEKSKQALRDSKRFDKDIATQIVAFTTFFPAEEYHQDYYKKSAFRYNLYKKWSGREDFIEKYNKIPETDNFPSYYKAYSAENLKNATGNILLFFHAEWCSTCKEFDRQIKELWDVQNITILVVDYDNSTELKQKYSVLSQSTFVQVDNDWNMFKRFLGKTDIKDIFNNLVPYVDILKKKLTPLQYKVTQESGTEKPFDNEYWDNHEAGIYVDIIDGTPLFSSTDKFDSGTGWPSFTKPIDQNMLDEEQDNTLFSTRTEIRSKNADSHLWHVFDDGPADKGGLRYCINSAALKFIPLAEMEEKWYEKYLGLFE